MARLIASGTLDRSFQGRDGKVLIGGYFTRVNGVGRMNIARLNADGSLDSNFQNALSGTDYAVSSDSVQNDGNVLIGGSFTIVDGVGRSNFASALASRRNATGAPQRAGRGVPLSGTVKWRRDTITESPTVESARDEWHQLPSESTAGQLRFGAGRSWRVRGSRCENQRGFAGSGCSGPK